MPKMSTAKSAALFRKAQTLMPGGVNSPVRAFKAVGGNPRFIDRASGQYLFDVDGNRYTDYVLSWGPLILGHAPKTVIKAICSAAVNGTSFGAPNPFEVELAERVQNFFPSIETIRMVSSGTEATMSALRLARAHTGRDQIAKFEGCYHGHGDSLLIKGGSGLLTLGIASTPGVPAALARLTSTLPFNDLPALEKLFQKQGDKLAAVIVEPVVGNSGVIIPDPGYLKKLRALCTKHGTVLIFDEVMTGFRVARGGAQEHFGIKPDLTTLGKVIGGGLPVGAFGGRRSIMKRIAPAGDVYQAGTLSGNPLAMAAGIATLTALDAKKDTFSRLESQTRYLAGGLAERAADAGVPVSINTIGSMFTVFFTGGSVHRPSDTAKVDAAVYGAFFQGLLKRGVYFPPSQFESAFMSTAHDKKTIDATLDAAAGAFKDLARSTKLKVRGSAVKPSTKPKAKPKGK